MHGRLKATGLPVEVGTGATKFNRTRLGFLKTHWLDAACIGLVDSLQVLTGQPLLITARGWGSRQMCITNKYGFPIRHRTRTKSFFGFKTGDIAQATLPVGKFAGTHIGRLIVRANGAFEMVTRKGKVTPVQYKYCKLVQKADGYSYVV
ncbi:hypothetical protein [Nostoc sp.]